jgi:hypothetical protein
LNSAKNLLVSMGSSSVYPIMTLFDLRQGTTQTVDMAAWLSVPAITSDGTTLAYFRADQDLSNIPSPRVELVLFDIARQTKTVLTDTLGSPFAMATHGFANTATFWSQDGERIIATTLSPQGGQLASLLARDGTLINTVPLPWGSVFGLTGDDQLVLDQQDGHIVRWLPLRAGAAPYAPDVRLTDGVISSIALPPSGRSTVPPPAARATTVTPLPVTQLPTPSGYTLIHAPGNARTSARAPRRPAHPRSRG